MINVRHASTSLFLFLGAWSLVSVFIFIFLQDAWGEKAEYLLFDFKYKKRQFLGCLFLFN